MVLVDESVKSSAWVAQDVLESLVDGSTLVTNFVKHRLQHNDVLKHVFFENIDLVLKVNVTSEVDKKPVSFK